MDPKSAKQRNQEVEEYLKTEKVKLERSKLEPRILILGTSDSGKSTLIKQLKIMHGGGFTKDEVLWPDNNAIQIHFYTWEVYRNLYTICITLMDNTPAIKDDKRYRPLWEWLAACLDREYTPACAFPVPSSDIACLFSFFWDEEKIQASLEKATEIGLQDTAS
ncbi:hypothetical protein HDV03_000600 [Kappamyces sp. JEL0829]|nr:hypothetical protein HDV03_000600 [Kappamyces sp. JEL0829]